MSRRFLLDTLIVSLLVLLGAASRLAQDYTTLLPPNFHAVTAATLFAGFYFRRWTTALQVPILAMILSDYVRGGYNGMVMVTVYASLALPIVWRPLLRNNLSAGRIAGCSLASSIIFYLTTNLAVWCCSPSHSSESLLHCYAIAIPFFGYTVAGDLVYSLAIFGAYALVKCYVGENERSTAAEAVQVV